MVSSNSKSGDSTSPCSGCGFIHQCVCELMVKSNSELHVILMLHPNEVNRTTNTGKLLLKALPHCQTFVWDRVNPPQGFIDYISAADVEPFIVFPCEDSIDVSKVAKAKTSKKPVYIILDGTWQEAKKMLRKSSWLSQIPAVSLPDIDSPSNYTLRRNQEQGHLCTLEVGCELLNAEGESEQADQLRAFFSHYLDVFQADRSGHKLEK